MARIIVYHNYYGCDTGCCGHTIELLKDGQKQSEGTQEFGFSHPYGGDHLEFAKEMVRDEFGEEHVKDLDWENCLVSDS